jgi:hypothetical protein
VSPEEEYLIGLSQVLLNTEECFFGYQGSEVSTCQILGFDKSKRFGINDIYVCFKYHRYGWIQRIDVDLINGHADIGHIATDADLTGIGLGKRLALGIGRYLKNNYGITEIHFCESSSKSVYPIFFTKTLGATYTQKNGNDCWVWAIP